MNLRKRLKSDNGWPTFNTDSFKASQSEGVFTDSKKGKIVMKR